MTVRDSSPSIGDRLLWLRSLYGRYLGASVSLAKRLSGLDIPALEALDCGCGLNDTVVSRQVLEQPFRRLVGVDGFPAVVELARARPYRAAAREVLCLPLTEVADRWGRQPSFDVALCLDVLEHLEKDTAVEFLRGLESVIRGRIVLWLPLGEYHVDGDPHGRGNDLELHRSFWRSDEIAALGYRVEVLPRFHNARYDALWGTKDLGG